MQIVIRETGDIKDLSITCPRSGVDYTHDFIGNANGFGNNNFVRFDELTDDEKSSFSDNDDDYYYAYQENFEWWENVVKSTDEAERLIHENMEWLTDDMQQELSNACADEIKEAAESQLQLIKELIANKDTFYGLQDRIKHAASIDELRDLLNKYESEFHNYYDKSIKPEDKMDYTDLKTFGDDNPDNTLGILSWSDDKFLVKNYEWQLIDR
ncbi:hypothetical protein [Psychrobacter sp. AOP31-A1-22]|uniref:hypothetical protein n=1 Tax=Psychrobacter sp. AOP31-A1-22 TaxID=3457696 RepID=UPI004036DCFC